ncbi:MAG: dTDP-glucose 4,6-dehydratase [Patescibacteria group bacterium]
MKLLITGGAGFIGSHFIKYILNKYSNYQIINLDKLTYAGNLNNLVEVKNNANYNFVHGDIANEEDVKKALDGGVDVIINYAAETHVDRSISEPRSFLETDVMGTFTLLEAVRAGKASKMIQISTDEVFGMSHDMNDEFTEKSKFDPSSPYSASKAGGDHLCSAYYKTYNTPIIITHSCNVYGPNQYPEKLIPLFITNLLANKKVPLYGEGNQFREWIFTEDHCSAIDLILHQGKIGEVYNIGTRQRKTNREIANLILEYLGKNEDYIQKTQDRSGHDFGYAVNHNKITNELGWKPKIKFQDGLIKTIEWHKKEFSISNFQFLNNFQ